MPDTFVSPQVEINEALVTSALLGHGLPSEAERHLWEAGLSYHLDDIAEGHLHEAEALNVARRCLLKAAEENNLPADWHRVRASDAEFGRYENILPRFFLFSLKGYAYLQMRLGETAEGRLAVEKLLELDPTDKIGAKVLLGVVERMGQDDD